MQSEMKFMDAGRKSQLAETSLDKQSKVYPRFTVDLDQFPGLECDVDESIELHLRGRICGVTHDEYSHTMDVEVASIAVPSHTHDSVGPCNEADRALGKMKASRRY